ncbi:MAG: WD40/YVTN/BNR-like repeat-containing protein [Flavisolibacter sp.]
MKALFASSFLFLFLSLSAQNISVSQLKALKPRNIGPAGMSGRITAIDVVNSNQDIWYVCSASGGVWKTTNAGASWSPIFDEQPTLNMGSIAIQQSNPSVVWAGTGEGNPRNSLNIGDGIFKSMDGGKTWKRMGLEKTRNLHRIIIDPTNPNIVYAAAIGNPYAEHPERGVYKTTDGGETWNLVLHTNDTSGCADLAMDPSNPNKLIANMWQHRRTPWSFKSGGPGSGLYITVDGGKNWKKLGKDDGLPTGNYGRIGIAFSHSMPSRVYAMIEATKNGLYRSDDGGFTWELVNSDPQWVTNRPFYFQDIAVDTKNENRLYSIHDVIDISEDGGKTFRTLLPYGGIHPDHHAWWISPTDPNFILDGNDGGMGITRDRGKSWNFNENLPVGQFYHINVDNEIPYNVMGGLQDNGSWHGPAYTWTNSGIRNYYWDNIGGGDGFDAMPDADNSDWVYSMSQGGSLQRLNYKTGERWFIKPPELDTTKKLRFNWNSAIAQDPFEHATIYYGSQFVHKSTDKGASWQIISPDLTTNDPVKIDQSENGGLTLDITGAENYCTIISIEPSAKEKNVIWTGTDDGNVQLTRDGGQTWTNFRGKIPGMPVGCWIPQIRASRYNGGEAFVVANDYRRGDFKPYIFHTTDYGKTWTNLLANKNIDGYALCMLQDPVEPNLIFVGSEHGLWISLDNGASFQHWKTEDFPAVSTFDLAEQERESDLVIASFGRAVWVMDDIRPLRKIAAQSGKAFNKKITVFEAPPAYQSTYRSAPGYEWSTYGLWDAENRRRGAAISYFVIPVKDTSVRKSDSLQVRVYNDKNELIRSLRWKADSGLNRQWWGMEERGFRQPGSARAGGTGGGRRGGGGSGETEPGGLQVFPGTYKVILSYARESDSTMITIKDDPRLNKTEAVKTAQRKMLDRLRQSSDKLVTGMDRLTESEEVLNKVTTELAGLQGKDVDSLRKSTTALRDSIKTIREFINGRNSDRQGLSRPPQITVMSTMQQAQQYIMAKTVAPGTQEEQLVKNAEDMINAAVKRINQFYSTHWTDYRKEVEGTKVNMFKDYPPIQ